MARVFRGKVAIPGEQMEAYFQALEQFEQGKKPHSIGFSGKGYHRSAKAAALAPSMVSGALAPSMVSRHVARGRRAGG